MSVKPSVLPNEFERLQELTSFDILGTQKNDDFDFITSLASQITDSKIALISFVTEDKQWFLSHHGLDIQETSREFSFCSHAIKTPDQPFIIKDARLDSRFKANPLTTGYPNVIFYAGIPLVSERGFPLGTLCVIDDQPKELKTSQLEQLRSLANQVMKLLELRHSKFELNQLNIELEKKITLFKETELANQIGTWELDIKTGRTIWTDAVYKIHEVDLDFDHNKSNAIEFYHPDFRQLIIDGITDCIENDKRFDLTCILITAKGNHRWVRSTGRKLGEKIIGSFQDITSIKQNELKFQGILNSSFSFIGFLDVNGVLLEANDTAVNMAGIKHKDVIGKYFWDCYWWQISSNTRQELKDNFERVLHGETVVYEVEVWIANETPTTMLFSMKPVLDEAGEIIFIISEGRPIQEIVEVRNRHQSVIEATQAGTYEWNLETDRIIINDRFATILGYTTAELQPITFNKWLESAHPEDLEKARELMTKCFKKELEFFELEMRMKHKSGGWIWVNTRGKIFEWSPEGKGVRMYGTMIEISRRKKMESKLQEERNLLRTIIDSSPDSIYVKDLQGRKLISNKADLTLCGANTEEDILGKTDEEIYPTEISKGTSEAETQVLVHGQSLLNQEGVLYDAQGNEIWLLTSKFPLYSSTGTIQGLVGLGRNITTRRKAEQEVIYNKTLLEALYNLSPIGIALNDFETGAFIDGNHKLLEPTGYSKDDFMKLNYWEVTPPEYEELEKIALHQMQTKGSYDLFEKEYIRKDGSRYPVALQGVVVEDTKNKKLIWSFVRDISAERESKRKLEEALAKLKAIVDASTQVSIIASDHLGVITLFNSGAEKMLEYTADELIGKSSLEILHLESELKARTVELENQGIRTDTGFGVLIHQATQERNSTKEWTYRRKDRSTIPVLLSLTPISQGGEIKGYLCVAADISKLKKVESEMKSLLDIAQDQNKRLRNFAFIVSHNLRSHTSGIGGLLEIFQLENPDLKQNELIQLIDQGAKNLAQTVEDLTEVVNVNLSRKEESKINLNKIIQKNIESLAAQINQSKLKVTNLVDQDVEIEGIKAYLESITLNFITNAIKYKSPDRPATLDIYSTKKESNIILTFQDNGLGIDLERHGDNLFGMYKTFHQHKDSRGVGLFITKNQIESMGGKISVTSEVGIGTSFNISFPIID